MPKIAKVFDSFGSRLKVQPGGSQQRDQVEKIDDSKSHQIEEMDIVNMDDEVDSTVRYLDECNESSTGNRVKQSNNWMEGLKENEKQDQESKINKHKGEHRSYKIKNSNEVSKFSELLPDLQIIIKNLHNNSLEAQLTELFIDANPVICHEVSDLNPTEDVIVVCPVESRAETDINYALQGINRSRILAVIILHLVRENQLPVLSTYENFETDEIYRNIQFLDMGFEGIFYDCEKNTKAKHEINELLNKTKTSKARNRNKQRTFNDRLYCVLI